MNKQEVIEEIKTCKSEYDSNSRDVWCYEKGFEDARSSALNSINKLDEPEKPVLSKEEAEWLESLEALSWLNKYDALYYIVRQGFGHGFSYTSKGHTSELETPTRICDTVDLKARLVNALLYGYEVEKEKLYTVKFVNEDFGKIYIGIFKKFNKLGISSLPLNDDEVKSWFTEDELKRLKFWDNPAFEVKEVKE